MSSLLAVPNDKGKIITFSNYAHIRIFKLHKICDVQDHSFRGDRLVATLGLTVSSSL